MGRFAAGMAVLVWLQACASREPEPKGHMTEAELLERLESFDMMSTARGEWKSLKGEMELVPPPEFAPHDSDARCRAEYLRGWRRGRRYAIKSDFDNMSMICFFPKSALERAYEKQGRKIAYVKPSPAPPASVHPDSGGS